jgi:DNA-binding response OmpR family regulator
MSKTDNHILVVDDDPDIGIMIKTMLEYKGYSVILVDRPENAEDSIKENMPDLIIMDMLLSGANGTDICTRLKQNPLTAPLPVMMISAHPNAKQICIDAGANDFISKPFDMQDILLKINRLMPEGKTRNKITK